MPQGKSNKKKIPSVYERTYLLCYLYPRTKTEIKKTLYGKSSSKEQYIEEVVPKLMQERLLSPIKPEKDKKNPSLYHLKIILDLKGYDNLELNYQIKQQTNERIYQRTYYLSSPAILLHAMNQMLNMKQEEFTTDEAVSLLTVLNSKIFRNSLTEKITFDVHDFSSQVHLFFPIINHLCNLTLGLYLSILFIKDKNNYKKKLIQKINESNYSSLAGQVNKLKNIADIPEEFSSMLTFKGGDVENVKKLGLLLLNNLDIVLIEKIAKIDPSFDHTVTMTKMCIDLEIESKKIQREFS